MGDAAALEAVPEAVTAAAVLDEDLGEEEDDDEGEEAAGDDAVEVALPEQLDEGEEFDLMGKLAGLRHGSRR